MNTTQEARKSYRILWIKYAAFYAIMTGCGLLIEYLILGKYYEEPWFTIVMTVLSTYVIAFPALLLLTRRDSTKAPEKNKMTVWGILAAVAVCMLFTTVGNLIGLPFNLLAAKFLNAGSGSVGTINNMINSESRVWSVINIIVIAVIGPVIEEIIFRKVLIDRVCKYGEVVAILASGIAFGLFHGDLSQVFYTTFLGIVFAYVYVKTGNLLHAIIVHVINNALSVIGSYLSKGVDIQAVLQGDTEAAAQAVSVPSTIFGLVRIILIVAGLVIFIVMLAKKKIRFKPAESQVPKGKGGVAFGNLGFILYAGLIIGLIIYELV